MVGEAAPPIKYTCPRCKAPLEAEAIEAGTKKNCPNCTQRHQVPAAPAAQPPARPALDKTMLANDEKAAPLAPPIKYNCPNCKKPLESPADQAGTKRNCPFCSQRLQVPAASAKPNLNKTLLASDESGSPTPAAPGAHSPNGATGTVPASSASPTNPWKQALTPRNVAIGVVVLLLLLLVVPAVIRGGKVQDMEALKKAELENERLRMLIEQQKLDMDRQAKGAEDARKKFEDEMRDRRAHEDRIREDNRRALAMIEDDERRAALKKKQQQEQELRDKEARERDAKFQQLLEDSQRKLDQAKRDLEASQKKEHSTQTIIQQPPVVYYPPYHPRYYWPWGW
jgi:DNA-directed RNA polymerase subunit RPC12/RpoP